MRDCSVTSSCAPLASLSFFSISAPSSLLLPPSPLSSRMASPSVERQSVGGASWGKSGCFCLRINSIRRCLSRLDLFGHFFPLLLGLDLAASLVVSRLKVNLPKATENLQGMPASVRLLAIPTTLSLQGPEAFPPL